MSVYSKLMDARIKLQGMSLKKSGFNKFAGYQYFELGDFLPYVQQIFNEVGLCGVVSFGNESASLRIIDLENEEKEIVIHSPMSTAALKGCHEVQNLGAVETYIRRYLWVTALEIVEHDALDATTKADNSKLPIKEKDLAHTPNDGAGDDLSSDQKNRITDLAIAIKDKWEVDEFDAMFEMYLELKDSDEKRFLWSLLGSKIRTKIKQMGEERKQLNG